jgi:phosphonoacetaldehyde hydrolase
MNKIDAIILDWAGTTIDYGCFAPVDAFIKAFAEAGLNPTIEEIRAHMGMQKKAHIAKMLYGKPHAQEDIEKIYNHFESMLFKVLEKYTEPLPGVQNTVMKIREMGIVIGSTTGYTQAMMDVIVPQAHKKGYAPDCIVCPDEVGNIGRPFPYMLWRNLEKLNVLSINKVLKIGDTAADMQEAKNAGCLCVGVLKGSSMLGLTEKELANKNKAELTVLLNDAKINYKKAGADFIIDNITELPKLIDVINQGGEKYV